MRDENLINELLELMPRTGRRVPDGSSRGHVLRMLNNAGGVLTPSELKTAMDVTTPRITAILNDMEERDLISRQRDSKDHRRIVITITEEGRKVLDQHRRMRAKYLEELLDVIGPEDSQALLRILRANSKLHSERSTRLKPE